MDTGSRVFGAVMVILLTFMCIQKAKAADPDITSDFVVPEGVDAGTLNGSFFTFSGFRGVGNYNLTGTTTAKVSKASVKEFAALEGQGVSYAVLEFGWGAVNPPHTHPRAAELLLVLDGWLDVGFVDTSNKLFTQTLYKGDVFVFPKGLLHFQINRSTYSTATAISAFGSSNAGTLSLPASLFSTAISDDVLAKSFRTTPSIVKALKDAFKSSP